MIWRVILRAWLLSGAAALEAADVKLATLKVGDEIYTNVTVNSATATDIYFSHSRGIGNAKLKNLDNELQKEFHFDPAKAEEKEKQQAVANGLYTMSLKQAKPALPPKSASEADAALEERGVAGQLPPEELSAKSFLNQPAPVIEGEKWLTERPDLKGKFVLIDFWATWCGPCRRSIPALNSLCRQFKDRLVVIGLSDETEEVVRKMAEPKIDYFVAIDTQHRTASAIGLTRIPHTLLVDPKGIVRYEGHPAVLEGGTLEKLFADFGQ